MAGLSLQPGRMDKIKRAAKDVLIYAGLGVAFPARTTVLPAINLALQKFGKNQPWMSAYQDTNFTKVKQATAAAADYAMLATIYYLTMFSGAAPRAPGGNGDAPRAQTVDDFLNQTYNSTPEQRTNASTAANSTHAFIQETNNATYRTSADRQSFDGNKSTLVALNDSAPSLDDLVKDANETIREVSEQRASLDYNGTLAAKDKLSNIKVNITNQMNNPVYKMIENTKANITAARNRLMNSTHNFNLTPAESLDEVNEIVALKLVYEDMIKKVTEKFGSKSSELPKLNQTYEKLCDIYDNITSGNISGDPINDKQLGEVKAEIEIAKNYVLPKTKSPAVLQPFIEPLDTLIDDLQEDLDAKWPTYPSGGNNTENNTGNNTQPPTPDTIAPTVSYGLSIENDALFIRGAAADNKDSELTIDYTVLVDGEEYASGSFTGSELRIPMNYTAARNLAGKEISLSVSAKDKANNTGYDSTPMDNVKVGSWDAVHYGVSLDNLERLVNASSQGGWDVPFMSPENWQQLMNGNFSDGEFSGNVTAADVQYIDAEHALISLFYVDQKGKVYTWSSPISIEEADAWSTYRDE